MNIYTMMYKMHIQDEEALRFRGKKTKKKKKKKKKNFSSSISSMQTSLTKTQIGDLSRVDAFHQGEIWSVFQLLGFTLA